MSALASFLKELRSALWRSTSSPPLHRPPGPAVVRETHHDAGAGQVGAPLDLGSLVKSLVAQRHARREPVRLLVDAGGCGGVPTRQVPEQVLAMRQEIDQLIDHALQHGGSVELVVREDRSGVRVSVNERRSDGSGLRVELQYPRAA